MTRAELVSLRRRCELSSMPIFTVAEVEPLLDALLAVQFAVGIEPFPVEWFDPDAVPSYTVYIQPDGTYGSTPSHGIPFHQPT